MYGNTAGESINDSVDNGDYPSTSIQWWRIETKEDHDFNTLIL